MNSRAQQLRYPRVARCPDMTDTSAAGRPRIRPAHIWDECYRYLRCLPMFFTTFTGCAGFLLQVHFEDVRVQDEVLAIAHANVVRYAGNGACACQASDLQISAVPRSRYAGGTGTAEGARSQRQPMAVSRKVSLKAQPRAQPHAHFSIT